LKDRIGFSPDESDACVLTFAEEITPKRRTAGRVNHSAVGDYRPFSDLDRARGGNQPGSAVGVYDPFRRQ
jgi:hypothetical protein